VPLNSHNAVFLAIQVGFDDFGELDQLL